MLIVQRRNVHCISGSRFRSRHFLLHAFLRTRSLEAAGKDIMKTLQELALQAVPNPGKMAKMYLVPWYPLAIQLEARDYEFREQHRIKFRYVVKEFRFIKVWYAAKNIYPSNVAFLDQYWTRSFGSKIVTG